MQRANAGPRPVGRVATAVLSALLLLVLAACEEGMEQETVQEPEQTDEPDDGTSDESDDDEQERLELGESAVLAGVPTPVGEGDGDDEEQEGDQPETDGAEEVELEVTASQLHDPVTAVDEQQQPDEGARLVAVEVDLENVGQADYEASVARAGELFLFENEDEGVQPALTEVDECDLIGDEDADEQASISLDSGDSRSGCLVFEVEEDTDPQLFEYELEPEAAALWELD